MIEQLLRADNKNIIVAGNKWKIGRTLQRVMERTVSTDGNGFFSGSTWIAREDTKADVIVLTQMMANRDNPQL